MSELEARLRLSVVQQELIAIAKDLHASSPVLARVAVYAARVLNVARPR